MRRRNPLLSVAGGLLIGLACFGLAFAYVYFVVRPSVERGTAGRRSFGTENVQVWYVRDSFELDQVQALHDETDDLIDELASPLGLSADDMPLPIELFLHGDVGQMIESVIDRDNDYRSVGWTVLDRLPWENARIRIAQLLLAYGWGKCTSQILQAGMTLVAAYPDRNFHTFVAALPEQSRHSVDELCSIESAGSFPRTFYQIYASPHANRFAISMSTGKRYYDLPRIVALEPPSHLLYLECASLVQHMIEDLAGLERFRESWGTGYSRNILGSITKLSGEELTRSWHNAVNASAALASDYSQMSAQLLLESGFSDRAFVLARDWSLEEMSPSAWKTALWSALLMGDRERSTALLAQPSAETLSPELEALFSDLIEGTCQESETNLRVISASGVEIEEESLERASATIELIISHLGLERAVLPDRFTVLICSDAEQVRVATESIAAFGLPSCLILVGPEEDPAASIASALPRFAVGESRSMLLTRGFAQAMLVPAASLEARADQIRAAGEWQPLNMLSYMGYDQAEVDIQSAVLVNTLLNQFGPDGLRRVWRSTSILGGGVCLDTAMKTHLGLNRYELEQQLLATHSGMD